MILWEHLPSVLAILTAASLALLMYRFASYPDAAEQHGHRPEQFGKVMAGRYAFMALMAVGAAVSGSATLVVFVLASLSAVAAWDAWVYASAGEESEKHVFAAAGGGASLLLIGVHALFGGA